MLDKSYYEMYSEYCEITKRELKRGDKKLREYLKRIREEKGLTQQYIAEKLGISQNYYCDIENGVRQKELKVNILTKLSQVMDVPIETLVSEEVALSQGKED